MESDCATSDACASDQLVTKTRTSGSVVWRWFGFKPLDEKQENVFCRECQKPVATKSSSTTNLFHHLQQRHPQQYEECMKLRGTKVAVQSTPPALKQCTLQASLSRAVHYEKTSKRWEQITRAIAYYIAKDLVPISTVERDGFGRLIEVLDPRYQLPNRAYFAREMLPKMYTEVRKIIAAQLSKVSYFAVTTDMWSSRTTEPYMCVTVHYIVDWELKSACLQTSYFPANHTGDNIAEALQDTLSNWWLSSTGLVAATTDNGSNVVKAIESNKWQRMQCFGHRLHLAIGHGMDDHEQRINRAISICKKIVSSFSYSWKKRRDLAEVQIQLNLPGHQLITESATRWGSRLQMIQRVLEQERAIAKVLSADKKTRHLILTWQDIEVLEAVQKALQPLLDFTDALSGEKYVTISYLRPVLHLFNTSLLSPTEGDSELCKAIQKTILDYLNSKYADPSTSDLLDISSLLDPRFKAKYIQTDKLGVLKDRVVLEAELSQGSLSVETQDTSVADPTTLESANQDGAAAATATGAGAAAAPATKRKKTLASFFKHPLETSSSITKREAIEKELSSFLLAPCPDTDANPLNWWKEHEAAFPTLGRLAKKYLCIPATSSPSERVFSCSGNIVTCKRASLKPESVDRLVFLAMNL